MIDIFIDNKSIADMGFTMTDVPIIPVPTEKVYKKTPPMRDGDLIARTGKYRDIEIPVRFNSFVRDLREFSIMCRVFTDAKEFYFNYQDDRKYIVKHVVIGDINQENFIKYGNFEVKFICRPGKYYRDETIIPIVHGMKYINEGTMTAEPEIWIKPNAEVTMQFNDRVASLKASPKEIYIDTHSMTIVNGEFTVGDVSRLTLKPGENKIWLTGSVEYARMRGNRRDF